MSQRSHQLLNGKRATGTFIFVYLIVTAIAFGLYLIIAFAMGIPMSSSLSSSFDISKNAAYLLSEKFYPILNLFVWAGCG